MDDDLFISFMAQMRKLTSTMVEIEKHLASISGELNIVNERLSDINEEIIDND